MRILLWHGYLLGGTGSNVYTRSVARAWSRAGHDVTVFSQEPHPEQFDIGDAETVRPDIDGLLPVFVLDDTDGLEARLCRISRLLSATTTSNAMPWRCRSGFRRIWCSPITC